MSRCDEQEDTQTGQRWCRSTARQRELVGHSDWSQCFQSIADWRTAEVPSTSRWWSTWRWVCCSSELSTCPSAHRCQCWKRLPPASAHLQSNGTRIGLVEHPIYPSGMLEPSQQLPLCCVSLSPLQKAGIWRYTKGAVHVTKLALNAPRNHSRLNVYMSNVVSRDTSSRSQWEWEWEWKWKWECFKRIQ